MSSHPRFIVGIDLGTTHTVVAFVDTLKSPPLDPTHADEELPARAAPAPAIQLFPIEQWVSKGELTARPLLPSARFHLRSQDSMAPGAAEETVAEDKAGPAILGDYALELGAKNPERLLVSAKSWLCHASVDREAAILPWGAPEEVFKTSPVEASASYLEHVRVSWNRAHPEHPLEEQEVLLTVPASFDESARALTLQAAQLAGFPTLRLVEEPLAAFYNWLNQFRATEESSDKSAELEEIVSKQRLALVVDCGGGTTDLTLIQLEQRESGPRLTRIAVGEHLLLGGDNMDLALAKAIEPTLTESGPLSPSQFSELVHAARLAKEELLSTDGPDTIPVTMLGSGSKLIGKGRSTEITRAHANEVVLGGFFPMVDPDAQPNVRAGAVRAFGLPYVSDPAITKHVASFLKQNARLARTALGDRAPAPEALPVPDSVLLNGGVFQSPALQARLLETLGRWRGEAPKLLEGSDPERAVARGAVAYGLARRGIGLRIGGGSPRSYFLVTDPATDATGEADGEGICILPKGSEEGEEVALEGRRFMLKLGAPVKFSVASSVQDVRHIETGALVPLGEAFQTLPPLAAVIDGGAEQDVETEIPVRLAASLTEVGTLEIALVDDQPGASGESKRSSKNRWKLAFELRNRGQAGKGDAAGRIGQLHPRFEEATARIREVYGKSKANVEGRGAKGLRAALEKILSSREEWDTPLLRELFGALLAGLKRRRRSADHERVWFNLIGYTLRPGFGYPLDDWRVEQVFALFEQGVQFMPETQNHAEWWIMWRRIAGGLSEAQQRQLLGTIKWYLSPKQGARGQGPARPKGPKWQGYANMVRLVGALERIDAAEKAEIGDWLIERLKDGNEPLQSWWAVGRLGARVPFYGSAHQVVAPETAEQWLEAALTTDWIGSNEAALAATLLSRCSGDRTRDLAEPLRKRVAARLEEHDAPASWVTMVSQVAELQASDQGRIFGDSLPLGLKLVD